MHHERHGRSQQDRSGSHTNLEFNFGLTATPTTLNGYRPDQSKASQDRGTVDYRSGHHAPAETGAAPLHNRLSRRLCEISREISHDCVRAS